jgi:hypothetical protein
MIHPFRLAIPITLMAASACAMAGTQLTPEQCSSYPFRPAQGQVTRADLSRELAELESVGYWPGTGNYSPGIPVMRARLNEKYARDCGSQHTSTDVQTPGG